MSNQRRNNRRRSAIKSLKQKDTIGLLLLGDTIVGKTALLKCWLARNNDGCFTEQYTPTVEDFYSKQFRDVNKQVNVGIIDIAGSGQFPAMDELYIANSDSIIFVYEIGNEKSIKSIERYFQSVQRIKKDRRVVLTVAGTKFDKYENFSCYDTEDIGKDYFSILKEPPRQLLTSAKNNTNVNELFEHAISKVVSQSFPDMSKTRAVSRYGELERADCRYKTERKCCVLI